MYPNNDRKQREKANDQRRDIQRSENEGLGSARQGDYGDEQVPGTSEKPGQNAGGKRDGASGAVGIAEGDEPNSAHAGSIKDDSDRCTPYEPTNKFTTIWPAFSCRTRIFTRATLN